MPVKDLSNSSGLTLTKPLAGSLIQAYLPLKPSSTTKWLKFQCIMHGNLPFSRMVSGVRLNACTLKPYALAALQMFFAFEPSRETPQSARTCSSGTHLL